MSLRSDAVRFMHWERSRPFSAAGKRSDGPNRAGRFQAALPAPPAPGPLRVASHAPADLCAGSGVYGRKYVGCGRGPGVARGHSAVLTPREEVTCRDCTGVRSGFQPNENDRPSPPKFDQVWHAFLRSAAARCWLCGACTRAVPSRHAVRLARGGG